MTSSRSQPTAAHGPTSWSWTSPSAMNGMTVASLMKRTFFWKEPFLMLTMRRQARYARRPLVDSPGTSYGTLLRHHRQRRQPHGRSGPPGHRHRPPRAAGAPRRAQPADSGRSTPAHTSRATSTSPTKPPSPGILTVYEHVDFRGSAHASALGKANFAQLGRDASLDHLSPYQPTKLTGQTITDPVTSSSARSISLRSSTTSRSTPSARSAPPAP